MTATSLGAAPTGPWSPPVRRIMVIGSLAGVVLGIVGVFGAGTQDSIDAQIVWMNVCVVGSIVAGCSQAAWLIEGRRSVSLLRRRALAPLVEALTRTPEPVVNGWVQEPVVVAGTATLHRPDCILVKAKATTSAPEGTKLAPCRVCIG